MVSRSDPGVEPVNETGGATDPAVPAGKDLTVKLGKATARKAAPSKKIDIKKRHKDKKKKKEKKKKEAILVRFDPDQLAAIDERAESLGLNRAAWLRMTVAQALAKI